MSGPRFTYLYNTVLDQTSTPVQAGLVTLSLLPTTVGVQYNVVDSFQNDTVTPGALSTKTANTAPASVPTLGHTATSSSLASGTYTYKVAFQYRDSAGIVYESAASVATATVTPSAGDTIHLTTIPVGGSTCIGRVLYRTEHTNATYGYLTTIADNTTTTLDDSTVDASLNNNRVPLALGEWQVPVIALGDLTPSSGALIYQVYEAGTINTISTFTHGAGAVHATTLYASAGSATTTYPFTGVVLDPGGNPKSGIVIQAQLNADGVSTQTSATISASTIYSAITNGSGVYTLNLVPTDAMTPSGLYYKVTEGPAATVKNLNAITSGGTVNGNLITPVAATTTLSSLIKHLGGVGTTTHTVNANAGTAASKDSGWGGSDLFGFAAWTSGSGSWLTGTQYSVTFVTPFAATPQMVLIAANANAQTALGNGHITWTPSTTGFVIANSNADSGATDYKFYYLVVGHGNV